MPVNIKNMNKLIYTGLGLGLAPKAPGTFGTLLGVALFLPLAFYGSLVSHLIVLCLVTVIGAWATVQAERDYGRHDAPQVVIDEVAGYLVTALVFWWFTPLNPAAVIKVAVLAFAAFRFFDILKPWPVNLIDRRCPGALGVMADDLAAGVYAFALCVMVLSLAPGLLINIF